MQRSVDKVKRLPAYLDKEVAEIIKQMDKEYAVLGLQSILITEERIKLLKQRVAFLLAFRKYGLQMAAEQPDRALDMRFFTHWIDELDAELRMEDESLESQREQRCS